jgi:hypothetical protein
MHAGVQGGASSGTSSSSSASVGMRRPSLNALVWILPALSAGSRGSRYSLYSGSAAVGTCTRSACVFHG